MPNEKAKKKKEPVKKVRFRHATLYEMGTKWATLFSNTRKVCDLVNFDAKEEWLSKLEAIAYISNWVQDDGTVFVSFFAEHAERKGFWLKLEGQTLKESLEVLRAQAIEVERERQEKRKRLGLPAFL